MSKWVNEGAEYEINYNGERTVIFLDENDINDDYTFLWFQKNNPGEKSWPNDLIQVIGEAVVDLDFQPDSFIASFKYKGNEYSAEIIKVINGYKIISYWLPDNKMKQKSYLICQKGDKWEIENYVGNKEPWIDSLGKAIQNHK